MNGGKVDIPSYQVKAGDVVKWRRANGSIPQFITELTQDIPKRPVPAWLKLDQKDLTGEVIGAPDASEVDSGLDLRLIVEFYSK